MISSGFTHDLPFYPIVSLVLPWISHENSRDSMDLLGPSQSFHLHLRIHHQHGQLLAPRRRKGPALEGRAAGTAGAVGTVAARQADGAEGDANRRRRQEVSQDTFAHGEIGDDLEGFHGDVSCVYI